MPTCTNCNHEWSWKQTIKRTTTLDPAMTCPNCEEKQYQTQKSKTKNGILNAFVLLPLFLNIFLDIPGIILMALFPILFILIMSLYPFFIELDSKEVYPNFFK